MGTALSSITTSIATGCPILATAKLRPPVSARASGLPGGIAGSPTSTINESATPGAAVATTIALPGARPVTSPVLETVATAGVPLVQVASEGDNCFPAISVTTAASCAVFPGLRVVRVTYPGLTRTAAGAVSDATLTRSVSAAPRMTVSTRPGPPVGLGRAVTVRSGATRMRPGVRLVNATGTPITGVSAESTLMRITSEPAVASVVSCGATVTTQPEPIRHGPI